MSAPAYVSISPQSSPHHAPRILYLASSFLFSHSHARSLVSLVLVAPSFPRPEEGSVRFVHAMATSSSPNVPVPQPCDIPGKRRFLIWRSLFEIDDRYEPIKAIGAWMGGGRRGVGGGGGVKGQKKNPKGRGGGGVFF